MFEDWTTPISYGKILYAGPLLPYLHLLTVLPRLRLSKTCNNDGAERVKGTKGYKGATRPTGAEWTTEAKRGQMERNGRKE